MDRVKNLPPAPDGYKYLFNLFREVKIDNRDLGEGSDSNGMPVVDSIGYNVFNTNVVLSKIFKEIPLKDTGGSLYQISVHRFRHTVATEMIDAGVDIRIICKKQTFTETSKDRIINDLNEEFKH